MENMTSKLVEKAGLAGATLRQPHICAFFHSQKEEYAIMLPFIKEGLERGEKAFHIINPNLEQDHLHRLMAVGINTVELERRKQLEIRSWEHTYLQSNGRFNKEDMLAMIERILVDSKREGFPSTRLIAHMEWSLQERPGVEDLVEYEARLNYILPKYNDPVICVYDLAQFSAGTVIDILRTHPMVIIGGTLQKNPFYTHPDEFLEELRSRTAQL